jgi:hypothetical protein
LEQLLFSYPKAQGVAFHSMELPLNKQNGSHTEILEKYKDIPMMSVDETFNTTFSFIITEEGSIVIFFIDNIHFVSVYTESTEPSKELARKMYEAYSGKFSEVLGKLSVR